MGPVTERLAAAVAGHEQVCLASAPLIYFIEDDPRRAGPVKGLLRAAAAGATQLIASVLTEAEMLVAPMRRDRDDVVRSIRELFASSGGPQLREVTRPIGWRAAGLRAELGLRLPDAIVVATAIEAGCTAIVGNDASFKRIEEIEYVHLDDVVGPDR